MLVLAIIAIITGTVVLGFTDAGRERHGRAEAGRLARLVELARDEALRGNEVWGLAFHEDQYAFQRYDPVTRQWEEVARRPFQRHAAEVAVAFEVETGYEDRARLEALTDDVAFGEETLGPPAVAIHPGGEVTPFEVRVALAGSPHDEAGWVVYSDGIAQVRLRAATADPPPSTDAMDDGMARTRWQE